MKKLFFLILFLGIATNASAQWKRIELFDFSGGLNDTMADISIKDNEATDIQNLVFTTGGNIKTRDGYALISGPVGTDVTCTAGTFYKKTSGSKYLVSLWQDDKIRKMDYETGGGPDGTWDDITGSLSFDVSKNNLGSFVIAEDKLIIEDGLNDTSPYVWTGSGSATLLNSSGYVPNLSMLAFHNNMCFGAGNDTYPSTLYFTDIGDVTDWSGGLSGNVSVETDDGSIIRAIEPGFDALYIWKDHSLWRLSGYDKDTFTLQRMISDMGTLCRQSVGKIGSNFIFQSDKGNIILYDGAVGIQNISSKIKGTIDELAFDRLYYYPGLIFDDDYYIAVTSAGGSENDEVLLFDTFHLAWTKFDGMDINAMWVAEDDDGKDMLVFGDYDGNTFQYPSGTDDNGVAISDYWISKQFRFPQLSPEKYLKLMKIFANQKGDWDINVETRSDYQSTGKVETVNLSGESSLYGVAIYGIDRYGGQNLIIGRIEPYLGKEFFQFKFYNENEDEPWELKGISLFFEESDRI